MRGMRAEEKVKRGGSGSKLLTALEDSEEILSRAAKLQAEMISNQ